MEEPTWVGVLWVVGGYLVGTIPSAYLVSRARRGTAVLRTARRGSGEADAHILMEQYLGKGWATVAGTVDVVKALIYPLVARRTGNLSPEWLALVGVAIVIGYGWPPYARALAGRGMAATAGVFLALLPVPMVITGIVILLGLAAGHTGLATTIGLGAAPLVAAIQGQPSAYVAMAGAIFAVVLLRRLEGVAEVVRAGVPRVAAAYYRMVFDSSGPPRPETGAEGKEIPPTRSSP